MTKFTKILAAVAMLWLVAVYATPLMAQQYDFKVGQLYYKITDATNHEVAVVSELPGYLYYNYYSKPTGAIVIPATVANGGNTYSVTSIGEWTFSGCSGLTSINISGSVTKIEKGTFYNCTSLTSVNLPSGLDSIGSRYFNWQSDKGVFEGCTSLTSINIPNRVKFIGEKTFSGCSGLTSINIPNSVTGIGGYTFSGCSGLTSITIPSSVTSIGQRAFYYCSGLTSINIPSSIAKIEDYTFYGCSGLTSITIPNSVTSIGEVAFSGCSGLTSIDIPSSVTSIGGYAFYGCSGLTSINIPSSITKIEVKTFYGCSGLTSINIPSSVTSIGEYTFYGCSGLTSITIPNSVTSIGGGAFEGCSGLTSINIPGSVTKIEKGTFYNCTSLTSVNLPSGLDSIGSRYFNLWSDKGVFEGCTSLTSINIPNRVKFIGEKTFSGCSGLISINIPNSVMSIGQSTFSGCSGLTSIAIPSSVTSIGWGAFSGCSGLTSIDIPNSVTSIGQSAFYGCSGLTSINIPNSVTSIGERAFQNCSELTAVAVGWQTPLQVDQSVFSGVTLGNVKLIVPFGKKNVYKTASVWRDFSPIVERVSISVTYNQSAGGTFKLKNGSQYVISGSSVIEGTVLTVEATPDQGYKLDGVKVNGTRISGLSFIVNSNSTIEAYFSKMKYTVTYTQPANGTLTVTNGLQTIHSGDSVEYGTSLTIEATPAQGYKLDSTRVNGTRISGLSFTVTSSSIVEVYFSKPQYTISYSQSAGGTFKVKNGSQEVASGSIVDNGTILTIEATSAQGYKLDSIRVNSARISGDSFTVEDNTTVEAFFSKVKHIITYNQSVGGTLTIKDGTQTVVSGSSVEYGTSLTIEATPAQGYKLDSIKVNGTRISGLSFTVDSNSTVEAYFSKMKYTVTYTQPANGTLTVRNGSQTIHSGDSVEYGTVLIVEATPYQGYKLDNVFVNGVRISGLSFTVTDNTNIEVSFGKQSYTVTYNSNMYSGKIEVTRGSEIVASGSSVEYGTQLMVRAIPNHGFEVKSLTINDQAIANNFVFSISEPIEIKAVFAPATTALDEAATKPLAIYPNPVAEVLYLSATARTIRIYDMYGTEVAHATDTDRIDVANLPAGIYTVKADGTVAKMVKR